MKTDRKRIRRSFALMVVLSCLLFAGQSALACTWDPIVNKCHPAQGEVVVYKHNSCSGTEYYSFNSNNQLEYPNLTTASWPDGSSMNDSISCYVIGKKTTFYYYQHVDFKGKSVKDKNSSADSLKQKKLGGTWWNDSISSVKVFQP